MSDQATPLVCIVVPVWNRADTIARAVGSALLQSEPSLEVVVVDNGSADGDVLAATLEGLHDPRVRLIRLPANVGPGGGRNAGVAASGARFVGFLDSDDELDPDWLASSLAPMLDDSSCMISTSGLRRVDSAGHETAQVLPSPLGPAFGQLVGRFDGPPTFLVRRALFDAIRGYDERIWFGENTELGLRLAASLPGLGTAAHVDRPLMTWHWDGPGRHGMERRLAGTEIVLQEHADRLALDRELHESYLAVAVVCAARLRRTATARRYSWRLVKLRPTPKNLGRWLASLTPVTARLAWRPTP